jgi:hypothetical protein
MSELRLKVPQAGEPANADNFDAGGDVGDVLTKLAPPSPGLPPDYGWRRAPAGIPSFFQWRGQLIDAALAASQPLQPTNPGTYDYQLEFPTDDWTFSEAAGPPRMVYGGTRSRMFFVAVNPHFESLATDGDAHLPFMNLLQNVTTRHHSHASVIIDVPPVLESFLNTATLVLVAPGDFLTLNYGSDNINPVATAIETDFFVIGFSLT